MNRSGIWWSRRWGSSACAAGRCLKICRCPRSSDTPFHVKAEGLPATASAKLDDLVERYHLGESQRAQLEKILLLLAAMSERRPRYAIRPGLLIFTSPTRLWPLGWRRFLRRKGSRILVRVLAFLDWRWRWRFRLRSSAWSSLKLASARLSKDFLPALRCPTPVWCALARRSGGREWGPVMSCSPGLWRRPRWWSSTPLRSCGSGERWSNGAGAGSRAPSARVSLRRSD